MESHLKLEEADLISDLMQGEELTKQLHEHMFSKSTTSSSHETKEVLLDKILLSYEKALTKLKWWEVNVGNGETKIINGNMMDSPCSITNENPKSEGFEQVMVKHKNVSKKRKSMEIWKKQVKVCSGGVIEGSLDDGNSWRKYGQKDIFRTNFPREYYRCTHKHAQGCLATKQVQKSDEDPTTYDITYKGRHTCIQANNANKAFPTRHNKHHNHQNIEAQEQKIEQPPHETIFTLSSELQVKIEDLEAKENIFPTFCFPSPSIGSENEDNIFSDTMIENPFMECFSPTFFSPATSESNFLCLSPWHFEKSGVGLSVQTSECDISDVVSATTSITNSPIVSLDELNFLLDNVDFDTFPMAYTTTESTITPESAVIDFKTAL